MSYDSNVVRELLKILFVPTDDNPHTLRESVALSPPRIQGHEDDTVLKHVDRLTELGWLRRTRDIRSRNHADPVTLRPTHEAREWATRARDDEAWERSSPELARLLDGESAPGE